MATPHADDQNAFSTYAQPLVVSPLTTASAKAAVAAAAASQLIAKLSPEKKDLTVEIPLIRPAEARKCLPATLPGCGQKGAMQMAMAELLLIEQKESTLRQLLDQALSVLRVS